MKNKLVAVGIFCLAFISCITLRDIPIQGSYPNPPITEETKTPFDQVWDNLIDYTTQRGLLIKVIDRSSGIIVFEPYNFEGLFSLEKKGRIDDPRAYIVTSGKKLAATSDINGPERVTGSFNFRLKKIAGGTLINVNLVNLKSYGSVAEKSGYSSYYESDFDLRTTGIFEQMIIDRIK